MTEKKGGKKNPVAVTHRGTRLGQNRQNPIIEGGGEHKFPLLAERKS